MKTAKMGEVFLLITLAALLASSTGLCQQINQDTDSGKSNKPPAEARAFWTYITKTDPYQRYGPYPAKGKDGLFMGVQKGLTPAKNPHGAYMKLFANTIAVEAAKKSDADPLPDGAVLVMENYDKNKKTMLSVTAMYKVKGFNAEGGDWFWAKYDPDGKPLEAGKAQSCMECHIAKQAHDWRWAGAVGHGHGHNHQ